jgi:hypothetical protein
MGVEQSKQQSGGASGRSLVRNDVESLFLENAKRLQVIMTQDKRKSALPSGLRQSLLKMANDIFTRQMEFTKGNHALVEGLREKLDKAYTVAFQPKSMEKKIIVRQHVDELVSIVMKTMNEKTQKLVPERRVNEVEAEKEQIKHRAALRNAHARADATRRVRVARSLMKGGGVLSWFSQQSKEPVAVPFQNYTRSMRSARRGRNIED